MPAKKLEALLDRVHLLANQKGLFLRQILWRNAGWGVMYQDPVLERERAKTQVMSYPLMTRPQRRALGDVVYAYRPTLRQALRFEERRLSKLPDRDLPDDTRP
jgi:hypothetical protein